MSEQQLSTQQKLAQLDRLLACPFCGGEAERGPLCSEDGGTYVDRMGVYCRACNFEMSSTPRKVEHGDGWPWRDLAEVTAKWNTRADLAPVAKPPIAEIEIASQSSAANTPYAVKEFVERVWALTQDRDGWSKVTLGGLTERLIRGLVTSAQQRGSELQREVDAKIAETHSAIEY